MKTSLCAEFDGETYMVTANWADPNARIDEMLQFRVGDFDSPGAALYAHIVRAEENCSPDELHKNTRLGIEMAVDAAEWRAEVPYYDAPVATQLELPFHTLPEPSDCQTNFLAILSEERRLEREIEAELAWWHRLGVQRPIGKLSEYNLGEMERQLDEARQYREALG